MTRDGASQIDQIKNLDGNPTRFGNRYRYKYRLTADGLSHRKIKEFRKTYPHLRCEGYYLLSMHWPSQNLLK